MDNTTAWFAISYSDMGPVSLATDTLLGGGPGRGGVAVDSAALQVRVPGFHLDIPRDSVRSASRVADQPHGPIGVHGGRGRWIVNGSHGGLVELAIEPPCYLPRQPSTLFRKAKVRSLTMSLVDPEGLIAALDGPRDA